MTSSRWLRQVVAHNFTRFEIGATDMANAPDITFLPLASLSRKIRSREISPVELTRGYLDRIAEFDGLVHSFNCVMTESALQAAASAEREIAAGEWRGPLHGIPVGIKDLIDVAGVPTTAQAAHLKDNIASEDAAVVSSLRKSGAVVLGKLATAEYAVGGTQIDGPWPPPRNPWNRDLDVGSSSSGSAISVAAGFCAGSVGSDTSGSIRAPAAWCGVAGLKPTEGLVSRRGMLPLSRSIDCIGPLAWTVEDCALMLSGMFSDDPDDLALPGWSKPDFAEGSQDIRGLRVGVLRSVYEDDPVLDAGQRSAMANSLEVLAKLGAVVADANLSDFDLYATTAKMISWPEEYAEHGAELEAHPERFGALTRSRLQDGRDISAPDHIRARWKQKELTAEVEKVLTQYDVLVLPTTSGPAPLLGWEHTDLVKTTKWYTRPFNLTGNPALSMCNGFTESGLPLSIQIVGRRFDDETVVRAGRALEDALHLCSRRPSLIASSKEGSAAA